MPIDYLRICEERKTIPRDPHGARPPVEWTREAGIILFRTIVFTVLGALALWLYSIFAIANAIVDFIKIVFGLKF
jgi:hypothetical protein